MDPKSVTRKLSAILSADVKGYSRLMGDDEIVTVKTITEYRKTFTSLVEEWKGRVIDSPGDNILAEFSSVVDAVQCAVEIQNILRDKNEELPENRRMIFRMGVNLGDVIHEDRRIYGDGVNIAARIESLADGGGISISGTAYDQIKNKLALNYSYMGEHPVKNISEPVRVYKVPMHPEDISTRKPKPSQWKKTALPVGVILILGIAAAVWWFYPGPPKSQVDVVSKQAASETSEKPLSQLSDKPTVAVLPFDNMSGDTNQEYFSDGISEDLITDLSKSAGLLVLARNSSFRYKGKPIDIKQIAKELDVQYVVEGSVRKAGEQVRINAQLIDASTGHHLWAERYDGKLNDIFALQDQIVRKIVAALAVELSDDEEERIISEDTISFPAYNAFLKGSDSFSRHAVESMKKGVLYFKKAIELDPKYWKAYAALGDIYFDMAAHGLTKKVLGISRPEACLKARHYLEISMKKPTVISYRLASFMSVWKRQYKEAIAFSESAISLNPSDSKANLVMSLASNFAGRGKQGVDFAKRAFRIDPGCFW